MKIQINGHDELDAFIRLIQEMVLSMESELPLKTDALDRYETKARIELLEELYPRVAKKQFNTQKKNSIEISKAICLIFFQYRHIEVDIYADFLRNRIVQTIHQEMV